MVDIRVERLLLPWGIQPQFGIRTLENINDSSVSNSFDYFITMDAFFSIMDEKESQSVCKQK